MNSYFSHDSNARNSEKLIKVRMKYGTEGYGVYFMILERLREEQDYMSIKDYNVIAFDLRVDASEIKSVVEDFGLFVFTDDGKYFYSEGFKKRMALKDKKVKSISEARKKAAKARWGNTSDANAMQKQSKTNANAMQNDAKKREVKRSKEKKSKPESKETVALSPHDQELSRIMEFYQHNLGEPAPVVVEQLDSWLEDHSTDWVIEALKLAADNHAQFGYAKSVMQRWQKEKINTVDQIKADQVSWQNRHQKGSRNRVPDYDPDENFKDSDLPF